ncbi:MAG: HAD family hydrolase [Candidatus Shapirobacteria bacterium]|jgi:phosphoglycolate phosphatase-like HAD superfamily hydrolase
MKQIKAIISDADGTLVNTLYMIRHGQYEAIAEYMIRRGIERSLIPKYEIYESYLNKCVGGDTRATFEKTLKLMFGENHGGLINKIDFDELDKSLSPIQDRLAPLYVHPFFGLTEFFTWIGKKGIKFGIYTSGSKRHIVRNFGISLPALGYEDLFKSDEIDSGERMGAFITRIKAVYGITDMSVTTCEDVVKTKPDPEGLLKLINEFGVDPDEVVVVGDLPVDMLAAKAGGVRGIGISHGFGSPADLRETGAICVVESLTSLKKAITAHNLGKKRLF